MIIYATINENQFLTPSTPKKGLKILKDAIPLNVTLDMTHRYHLNHEHIYKWPQDKSPQHFVQKMTFWVILTVFSPKKGVKMEISKNPSA